MLKAVGDIQSQNFDQVALKSCFEVLGADGAGREDASSIAQASTIKVDCFNKLMEKMGVGDTKIDCRELNDIEIYW